MLVSFRFARNHCHYNYHHALRVGNCFEQQKAIKEYDFLSVDAYNSKLIVRRLIYSFKYIHLRKFTSSNVAKFLISLL